MSPLNFSNLFFDFQFERLPKFPSRFLLKNKEFSLFLLTAFLFIFSTSLQAIRLPTIPLQIDQHTFTVEVAQKPADLRRGLMGRKTLGEDKGMLFVYKQEKYLAVWMKNTLIPLDILFLNKDKKIVHIHHNARPLSTVKIISPEAALYFIELPGGTCKYLNIHKNSVVGF